MLSVLHGDTGEVLFLDQYRYVKFGIVINPCTADPGITNKITLTTFDHNCFFAALQGAIRDHSSIWCKVC